MSNNNWNNDNDNGSSPAPVPAPSPAPTNPDQNTERIRQEQERESFKKRLREEETVRQTFAQFQLKVAPEDVLRSVGSISFDADGVPHCRNTGKPLRDSIEAYVKSHPFTVASSPLEAHRPQDHIRSKADLKSIAEKSQYLEMYGEAQYARLPLTAQDPVQLDESLTWEQYKRLSVAQKVLLVNKYGEGFAARLHQKEQQKVRDLRLAGIPLERIKK